MWFLNFFVINIKKKKPVKSQANLQPKPKHSNFYETGPFSTTDSAHSSINFNGSIEGALIFLLFQDCSQC